MTWYAGANSFFFLDTPKLTLLAKRQDLFQKGVMLPPSLRIDSLLLRITHSPPPPLYNIMCPITHCSNKCTCLFWPEQSPQSNPEKSMLFLGIPRCLSCWCCIGVHFRIVWLWLCVSWGGVWALAAETVLLSQCIDIYKLFLACACHTQHRAWTIRELRLVMDKSFVTFPRLSKTHGVLAREWSIVVDNVSPVRFVCTVYSAHHLSSIL